MNRRLLLRKLLSVVFILCFCTGMFAQKTITGTVKDARSDLLTGVSVSVKDSKWGTITDMEGNFSFQIQPGDKVLVFSYLGMNDKTVVIGNQTHFNVTMEENSTLLGEVVVSALGINRDTKSLPVAQQRVNAGTIAEVRDPNIVSSLAGKVAGVMVTPPTSSTGSARIVIRGNSSFTGNNQPLFVVDGMAIDNNDGSKDVNTNGGLDMGNGAADINPDDIESIDVLKGPNAAALYGSRAANGVIIITTKKAKANRFKVSFNSNTMFRYITQWPEFQNSFGMGHMNRMVGSHGGWLETTAADGSLYSYPGIPRMSDISTDQGGRSNGGPMIGTPYIGLDGKTMYTYSPQPDNVYDFYQKASTFTNNINLEGGNADNNYRVSLTNFNADDVVDKQNLVNKNTLNLRFLNKLIKNMTLDSKFSFTDEDTKNRRYANQSSFNPLYMYTLLARSMTLEELKNYKTPAGTETTMIGGIHNPYWSINETGNEDTKMRIMGNFDLSYQILPSLKATLRYGREYISVDSYEYRNKGALGGGTDAAGYYKRQYNITDNSQYDWLLVFNDRFFNNRISILASLGGQQLDYKGSWLNASLQSLKQQGFPHISNSNQPPQADEDIRTQKRIRGLFGSLSIGYRDFIFLDLTGRNDWSSTLPPENNSYFYPSVGVSWLATEMFGIPSGKFYGKLRASYAQVGNDTHPYRLKPYMDLGNGNLYGGYKYVSLPGTLPNSHLKPERTRSYEVGTDIRLLNSRLNLDVTYYYSESFDQIVEADMSYSSGYEKSVFNAGEIRNKGWEIAMNTVPVRYKDFQWDLDFNFTKNESDVTSMVEGLNQIQLGQIFEDFYNVLRVGLPYGSLYGSKWVTDQQGRKMVTANGEPVKVDYDYLGNFNPDFMFSVANRFKWRNIDAYVLVDMKKGGKLYSGTMRQTIRNGVTSGSEKQKESYWERTVIMGESGGTDDLWGGTSFDNLYIYDQAQYDSKENMNPVDPNYVPQQFTGYLWPGEVGYWADKFCSEVTYDASFVKLREFSIGYNFSKSLISKIKMSNARISAVGRNLWIIYQKTPKGIDPEAALNAGNGQGMESGSLPPCTTFGIDLKIAF